MKHKTWLADHSQSALIYRIIELLFQLHWFLKDKDYLKKKTKNTKTEHLLQNYKVSGCREYGIHDVSQLQTFDRASQEILLTELIHFSLDRNKIIQSENRLAANKIQLLALDQVCTRSLLGNYREIC